MNILIVDDEELMRTSLHLYLKDNKIPDNHIFHAENASVMIRHFEEQKIHIAFIDIRMPGMDGLSAIEACKKMQPEAHYYVLTGYSEFEYAHKALQLHIEDYLLKPVLPEQIHRILQKERLRFQSSSSAPGSSLLSVKQYIETHYREKITLPQLSGHFGYTPNYLSSAFRKYTGLTVTQYLNQIRLSNACRMLAETDLTVQEIAEAVGFLDSNYFTRMFNQQYQCSPTVYRKRNGIT